ncbi:MAG: hypothetical protein A2Y18_04890 [Clostridiales bacterium GWD2_32_19]|nr:MAG: hypothetical protein A2Y18_04890 [Clostridiales bacterium GWD2_32_19]
MAKMIPENISVYDKATYGEKKIFTILKTKLPDDYIVWYNLRINGKHPDFVILSNELNITVLEVKDWNVNYIKKADKYIYETYKDEKLRNPIEQVRYYMIEIVRKLEKDQQLYKDGYLKINYGHAVVFCNITRKEFYNKLINTVDEKDRKCFIFKEEISEFNKYKDKLIDKLDMLLPYKIVGKKIKEEDINNVRKNLCEEVVIHHSSDDIINLMSLEQEQFSKTIGYGHRVIKGCAGSGKTVILMCRAKYLADSHEDWNILVLTYNKVLSKVISNNISCSQRQNIKVYNFHAWMNMIAKKLNLLSENNYINDDFSVTSLLSQCEKKILTEFPKYDAILIDEGQDFEQTWLKFIIKMLRDSEKSHLFFVSDGAQNLYSRKYTLKSVGINAKGRTTQLTENYRNTRQILEYAYGFLMSSNYEQLCLVQEEDDNDYLIEPNMNLRSGSKPKLIYCNSFNCEVNDICEKIKLLRSKTKIREKDICVVYPITKMSDAVEREFVKNKIKFENINRNKYALKLDAEAVKLSTIHSVKGLDFKVVFICGLNDYLEKRGYNEYKKLIYVGMTRARDVLVITYSSHNQITQTLERVYEKLKG